MEPDRRAPPDDGLAARARRVALLAPMPSELRPLVRRLGLSRSARGGSALWAAKVGRLEVVAARTGIGMRAAAACAARVIDAASPDHLIVVGIAGGIGPTVAIGDLVVPVDVVDLATGARFRPVPLGETEPRGALASSDALLASPDDARRLEARGVVAIDMETAAVARVCAERGCPWSVFRAISDRADDGSTDAAVFALAGPDGRPDLRAVARFVLRSPHRIPQLVRLARGADRAARTAAAAATAAIRTA